MCVVLSPVMQLAKPRSHTIIECSDVVLERLRLWAADKPSVRKTRNGDCFYRGRFVATSGSRLLHVQFRKRLKHDTLGLRSVCC